MSSFDIEFAVRMRRDITSHAGSTRPALHILIRSQLLFSIRQTVAVAIFQLRMIL